MITEETRRESFQKIIPTFFGILIEKLQYLELFR